MTKDSHKDDHILEVLSKDDANGIIKEGIYRCERFSENRNCYILMKKKR